GDFVHLDFLETERLPRRCRRAFAEKILPAGRAGVVPFDDRDTVRGTDRTGGSATARPEDSDGRNSQRGREVHRPAVVPHEQIAGRQNPRHLLEPEGGTRGEAWNPLQSGLDGVQESSLFSPTDEQESGANRSMECAG